MTKHHKKKYGQWAGNPRGSQPDLTRCAEEVYPKHSWFSRQCTRKCGHGPDGAFCKQHAKGKTE